MSSSKVLTLKSNDDEEFMVDETLAMQSETIKNMVEDDCASNIIPIPNVDSKTLATVIRYWKKHGDAGISKEELAEFDKEFFGVHHSVLHDVILAANYLNAKGLLEATCQEVADRCKGKTPEAIRKEFDIKNDFTPEQEEEYRQKHAWAFD